MTVSGIRQLGGTIRLQEFWYIIAAFGTDGLTPHRSPVSCQLPVSDVVPEFATRLRRCLPLLCHHFCGESE